MLVSDLFEVIKSVTEDPKKFKVPLMLRRLNQHVKFMLRESDIWKASATLTLSATENTVDLPAYLTNITDIKFKNASGTTIYMELIDKLELDGETVADATPLYYYKTPTLLYFNASPLTDITVYISYNRTLEDDLLITNDIQTVIPPFKEQYNTFLETLLTNDLLGVNPVENLQLSKAFAKTMRYETEKDFQDPQIMKSYWEDIL